MSKSILGVALTVVGVALLAIPGIGEAIGLPMIAAGISSAAVIGVGLMVAGSLLMGPTVPKGLNAPIDHNLYMTLVPTSPRKWAFGIANLAVDARYQTLTGSNQDTYWLVVCHASHEVHSIDELWLDNEKAWTSSGGVQGRYVGYLTAVAQRTVGTSSNGVLIDTTWTATCTLTGCAYTVWSFKLSGNSDNAQSPFQGGVTSRMTFRGHGAKTYDPRLDSTVSGGSGTQRATDQTTWIWDDNASRNPALQLLWYLLGWQINGKLAVGMGLPASRIDLPSFITAANACDEAVTLNGGGTEPRYRCDGVIGEDEDRKAVVESLCTQMNATLRDSGGKLTLYVLHNDLGTPAGPVGGFSETDILEGGTWKQTPPLTDCFNIVRGRRIDPSDTGLYQPVDFPEVSLTSPDGIDRIQSIDYPFVQSNGQAQRLAKQFLERNQYQGRYEFIGGERWWQVNIGDVVPLSHAAYGWSSKLFRVVGQAIDPGGPCRMALLEENAAIYAWSNNEAAPITPGAPTIYNPLNNPLLLAINQQGGAVADANRVRFSLFERGTQGWAWTDNPNSLAAASALSTLTSAGINYLTLKPTFTANGQSVQIGTETDVPDYKMPVTVGERLAVACLIATGGTMPAVATITLQIGFLDSTGVEVPSTRTSIGSFTGSTGGASLSGFCTVPASATHCFLRLLLANNTGGAGSFDYYLAKPMVCAAGAFQTVAPTFSPGPSAEYAANNSALGDGNRVRFSKFERGAQGWIGVDFTTAAPAITTGTTNGKNWIKGVFNFTANGQQIGMGTDTSSSPTGPYCIPCNAGETVFASAGFAFSSTAGSTFFLQVGFINSAGTEISRTTVATGGGGGNPFDSRCGGFAVAPAGTVAAFLRFIVQNGTGGALTGAFIQIDEPMLCGAGVGQNIWPPFVAGPSNEQASEINKWVDNPSTSTVFNYDYQGNAQTGQFPRDLAFKLNSSAGVVTSGVTWAYAVKSGIINGFNNASGSQSMSVSSGIGTLTVSSLGSDAVTVEVTATVGTFTYKNTIPLSKAYAAAPVGGGGGSSSTTLASQNSGFTSISSTTPTAVTGSSLLAVTMPTGVTTAKLNATLGFNPNLTVTGTGNWTVNFKWQRKISGVWTDQGSPVSVSGNTDIYNDPDTHQRVADEVSLVLNQTITGLTAGTAYDWQIVAWLTSGTRQHDVSGIVSITT